MSDTLPAVSVTEETIDNGIPVAALIKAHGYNYLNLCDGGRRGHYDRVYFVKLRPRPCETGTEDIDCEVIDPNRLCGARIIP